MSRDRTRPLSAVEVENALQDEVDHLEALTNGGTSPKIESDLSGYDDACRSAAEAEAEWKITQAKGLIGIVAGGNKDRRDIQEARVLVLHRDLYRAYKLTGGAKEAHKEALLTSRARIEALRTIAANVRAQS